jgi:hypothetical protein
MTNNENLCISTLVGFNQGPDIQTVCSYTLDLASETTSAPVGVTIIDPRGITETPSGVGTSSLQLNGFIFCGGGGSDAELKTDITPLGMVNELNGVRWEWNDEAKKHFGYDGMSGGIIAQDLEKIMPWAVGKGPGGYRIVNYNAVTGLLVEAVKELNEKLKKIENGN